MVQVMATLLLAGAMLVSTTTLAQKEDSRQLEHLGEDQEFSKFLRNQNNRDLQTAGSDSYSYEFDDCPAGCFGTPYSCDEVTQLYGPQYTCAVLEGEAYGCDCGGCGCAGPPTAAPTLSAPPTISPVPTPDCPATCNGAITCDWWTLQNRQYTCDWITANIGCDCRGCVCAEWPTPAPTTSPAPTISRVPTSDNCPLTCGSGPNSCDTIAVVFDNPTYTCALLESEGYGCDCGGCDCALDTSPQTAAPTSRVPIPMPTPMPTTDDTATVTVGLSLAMDGIACADYGTAEEAVMNTALATHLDGVDASDFGDHVCTDVSRRRALKTSSASIYTEVSVDATTYADDDIASAVSTTITTAVSTGALASSISTAASAAGVDSMDSLAVTGATSTTVDDDGSSSDPSSSISGALGSTTPAFCLLLTLMLGVAAAVV